MGIFDIENTVSYEYLESKGFEKITKNTWRLQTSKSGHNQCRWWRLPVTIDYDIKRKMFRVDFKQKYFADNYWEFNIIFNQIIKDTDYNRYRLEYEHI